nr:hypothetical protein [Tanacetum cinerariifolium]
MIIDTVVDAAQVTTTVTNIPISAADTMVTTTPIIEATKTTIEMVSEVVASYIVAVILNGESPVPTRVVDSVLQPVAPTTAKQKLARKNELKARGSSSKSLDQIHDRLQKLVNQLTTHGRVIVKAGLLVLFLIGSNPVVDIILVLLSLTKTTSPKFDSSGKRRNRKACFVYNSMDYLIKDCNYHAKKMAQPTSRNYTHRGNHKQYALFTHTNPQKYMVPPIVFTQTKPISFTAVSPVSAVVPKINVTRPKHVHLVVTKSKSPIRRHITRNPSPKTSNSPPRVTAAKALVETCLICLTLKSLMVDMLPLEVTPRVVGFLVNAKLRQNRVLVTKPHNKTPYELLHGRTPSIGFMRPFGCPVTIHNTLDSLGKFNGKVDEGFLVGYSIISKAFRVFNSRTCIVQETLHVNFLENKPIVAAKEEIDQQYVLFVWSSSSTNPQNNDGDVAFDGKEHDFDAKKPKSKVNVSSSSSAQTKKQDDKTKKEAKGKSLVESLTRYRNLNAVFEGCFDDSIKDVNIAGFIVSIIGQISPNSTNIFSAASPLNVAASPTYGKSSFIDASQLPDDPDMLELEDIIYFDDDDNVGAEADFNNLETSIIVSPIPTTRVHKDHHVSQIIGDLSLTTQTRSMIRMAKDQRRLSQMFDDDFHTYMFACFLLQEEPKRVHQALKDLSWIEAMQEELLQFKMQKFWILVNLPHGKRAIGTKWVFKNTKDERGIVIRNKAILVAQGHTQEEEINYE